ncbi:MAG: hypothetical protein K6E59_06245 [Bacilli bacterium]|nr:hypothetical protein [Bacilli bacterium]
MRTLALVQIGNFFYFLFIFLLIGLVVGSILLCRKLGKKFSHRFISIILWANFALHILKQFLPLSIAHWPTGWTDSAFPNLCATLIVVSPFIFHWGNKYMKDYMYYMGVISGILVYLVPTGAMRSDITGLDYAFETARFYFCHWPMVVCGILMVEQGFHKLDWKRLWAIPFLYCAVLAIISLDQILFGPILKVPGYPTEWLGENGVLYRANFASVWTNQSMQFGPQPGVDAILGWAYPYLIPGLMTFQVDGVLYFTPVIWIFPFIAIGTALLGPLMALPFEHRQMGIDLVALGQRNKMRRNRSRNAR